MVHSIIYMYLKIVIEKNNTLTSINRPASWPNFSLQFYILIFSKNIEMEAFIQAINLVFDPMSPLFDMCLELINTNLLQQKTYGDDVKPRLVLVVIWFTKMYQTLLLSRLMFLGLISSFIFTNKYQMGHFEGIYFLSKIWGNPLK